MTIGRLCVRHDASSLSIRARLRRRDWDRTLHAAEPRERAMATFSGR